MQKVIRANDKSVKEFMRSSVALFSTVTEGWCMITDSLFYKSDLFQKKEEGRHVPDLLPIQKRDKLEE